MSASFDAEQTQYYSTPSNDDIKTNGESFGAYGFIRCRNPRISNGFFGKIDGDAWEWALYSNAAGVLVFSTRDSVNDYQRLESRNLFAGEAIFVALWYDATSKKKYLQLNNGIVVEQQLAEHPDSGNSAFSVGRVDSTGNYSTCDIEKLLLCNGGYLDTYERMELFNRGNGLLFSEFSPRVVSKATRFWSLASGAGHQTDDVASQVLTNINRVSTGEPVCI